MLKSRKDDSMADDEVIRFSGDERLTIEERRARRKAKQQQDGTTSGHDDDDDEDDDFERGSATTEGKSSPTRSRNEALRDRERDAQTRAEQMPVVGGIAAYFRGVVSETRKVTWPTREETWRLTRIVIGVTVVFSIMLGIVDLLYGEWFRIGVDNTTTFLIISAIVCAIGGVGGYYLHKNEII